MVVLCHWVLSPMAGEKNLRDTDKMSYLSLCLSVEGMSVVSEQHNTGSPESNILDECLNSPNKILTILSIIKTDN